MISPNGLLGQALPLKRLRRRADRGQGNGYFYVQVPDSGSGVQLRKAMDRLSKMPQIEDASLNYRLGAPAHLTPFRRSRSMLER